MKNIVILFSVLIISACNLGAANGYVPTSAEIRQIKIHEDTKSTIVDRFGPATSIGETDAVWYYVASERKYPGSFPTVEVERRVLAIRFSGDRVAGVTEFGQERGQDIPVSRYTTETGGRELSLWEQLVGNIGNFSAERFLEQAVN